MPFHAVGVEVVTVLRKFSHGSGVSIFFIFLFFFFSSRFLKKIRSHSSISLFSFSSLSVFLLFNLPLLFLLSLSSFLFSSLSSSSLLSLSLFLSISPFSKLQKIQDLTTDETKRHA
jgi:phosphoglycerol transferase MdoB-like AlkP superfamily enzyme